MALLPVPAAVPGRLQAHRRGRGPGQPGPVRPGRYRGARVLCRGARPEAFSGMSGALEALKSADQAYRDSLPDITHHHIQLLVRPRLWTAIHRAWVQGWKIRHMADAKTLGLLGKNPAAALLFILLGLLPLLTPVLLLLAFPGRSVGLWLLFLLPLLGPFARKLWGRADIRRHAAALVTKAGYLGPGLPRPRRGIARRLAPVGPGQRSAGPGHRRKAVALCRQQAAGLPARRRSPLPDGQGRFKERLYLMFVKPVQLYFKPAVREKWLQAIWSRRGARTGC